jgi:hypothetical protein
MLDADKQVTPDQAAQMVRWHEIGCTAGSTFDCTALARMLMMGDPFPSDRARGYALFAQLCEGGEEDDQDGEGSHGRSGNVTVGAGVQLEGKSRRACR